MRKEEKKINDKGFSLVELIVVIAIMVALVAVVAVAVTRYVAQSRAATDVTNAQTIKSAIQVEITDPTEGLSDPITNHSSGTWTQVPSGMASLMTIPQPSSRDMTGAHYMYSYTGSTSYVGVGLSADCNPGVTGYQAAAQGSTYDEEKDLTVGKTANAFKKGTGH